MSKVTLGGERLGSGNRQEVELRNYERSTHDLSYVWRSTMASGTLVPFMNEVALPGDTFDIDLDIDVKTHPTIGPLFGSYKIQLDVFKIPVRLYQAKLHMNLLNVGLKMNEIKLPQLKVKTKNGGYGSNEQINPSCLLKYLGISGLGKDNTDADSVIKREFNAVPYLAMFDIYKQYYSNKQEEYGVIVHNDMRPDVLNVYNIQMFDGTNPGVSMLEDGNTTFATTSSGYWHVYADESLIPEKIIIKFADDGNQNPESDRNLTQIFRRIEYNEQFGYWLCDAPQQWIWGTRIYGGYYWDDEGNNISIPKLKKFPLENIDEMRKLILADVMNVNSFKIDENSIEPYSLTLKEDELGFSKQSTQEGLLIKTYQSDLFNNWVSTEWIDGPNGINSITAIDTSEGNFTIDTLQLSRKVYDMLNRIAVSGGTYDDWLDAVYTHERTRGEENPVYMGGLIKELAFQEVVSTTGASESTSGQEVNQPLGTLAGRGILTKKHKGGKVYIKVDEPSYIMGIVSLTPRVDYSQGNKWDVNLKTMDDFHKPGLDEIGFQDLITEQMAWWDTDMSTGVPVFSSAGKQPAWINYMTNVNKCYGNFAEENQQMYMTLNRRYEQEGAYRTGIKDLTTYVDPTKFNQIFADTRIDAQNFWTQIAVDITARRKMSAKLMPNL